jgi:Flp pilus assembly protein TadB
MSDNQSGATDNDRTLSDASLGELVAKATSDLQALVQSNIDLAKAEMRESAQRGAAGGALVAAAVGLLVLVGLLLTFAAVYGLVAAGLDVWAAFLIIAGIYLLIALILAAIAAAFFKRMKGPEQAKAEAQETVDTLKGSLSAGAAAAHGEPVLPAPEAATQASA